MSDDNNAAVDPRFDPAFQRGFDSSVPIETSVPEPKARKSALAEPRPVAKAAPAPVTAVAPAPRVLPVTPEVVNATPAEDVSADATSETSADDASAGRNPFLLFLGIIAVALFATGIWLFVRSGDEFNSKVVQSQGDYMSLTATINVAPFIAMLGAVTAIGVLFVFALRWRKK